VRALEKAGQPVVTLTLRDKLDLGGEFLRWEVATAIAGSILGIDAFDQPNVQESKDNTNKVLSAWRKSGKPPAAETVPAAAGGKAVAAVLRKAKKHAYVAFMAYTAMTPGSERAAGRLREAVREKTAFATTWGYGPRFLHSTGQLHKGGPKTGVFVQIVQEDARDAAIPGQPFSFSTLKQAQALGDYQSLTSRGYPVARITLGRKPAEGWKALTDSVAAALRG
jgi:hypothetical protein